MTAGRICPLHYQRDVAALRRPAEARCDRLWIAGGLYGNLPALDTIEEFAEAEQAPVLFNGDWHWFDADAAWFAQVDERLKGHWCTAGNVEAELAEPSGVGCGCAYPETVPAAFVERSNQVMAALQAVVTPTQRARLVRLAFDARVDVGGLRVAVIHGDPTSLAGWGLAIEEREGDLSGFRRLLADWFALADVDVIACAHTCLPHAMGLEVEGCKRVVINNGAAGLGNFEGDPRGLVTRIAPVPSPTARYRGDLGGMVIEAVPVPFDLDAWRSRFESIWPPGSAAALNYLDRLVSGPHYAPARAVGDGFEYHPFGT